MKPPHVEVIARPRSDIDVAVGQPLIRPGDVAMIAVVISTTHDATERYAEMSVRVARVQCDARVAVARERFRVRPAIYACVAVVALGAAVYTGNPAMLLAALAPAVPDLLGRLKPRP